MKINCWFFTLACPKFDWIWSSWWKKISCCWLDAVLCFTTQEITFVSLKDLSHSILGLIWIIKHFYATNRLSREWTDDSKQSWASQEGPELIFKRFFFPPYFNSPASEYSTEITPHHFHLLTTSKKLFVVIYNFLNLPRNILQNPGVLREAPLLSE